MANNQAKYFAAKDANDTTSILLTRANSWYNELDSNGYLDKLRMMWASYHGAYFDDFSDGHRISFMGEQGELVGLAVNHIRNLGQHMLNMVTATRPSLQARATNNDHTSLVQTKLANGLLDYYLREKRLEDYFKVAVEYAIVLGSGYVKMEWNAMTGEIYDVDEITGEELREGDIEFSNLSPFDVVFDPNREDQNHDWVLCRSFKNRHDIIAKYPEFSDEIMSLETKNKLQNYYMANVHYNESDLVPVYEFYHKRSESLPEGRYLLFLSENIVLLDGKMPYSELPVYRIAPSNIIGTPYGYTPLFDILPIQEGINSLYSTILTNQNAFGVQNILVPRGADVSISELSGGLNIIEANTQFGNIEPMNLTATPREIFEFLKMLEQAAETVSGINSVARGQPEPSLKSGTALALMQSNALQFMSGLQQSYVQMMEDAGTGLINILKDHASAPRIVSITGKRNITDVKEFTGEDLLNIRRTIVDIGNPLAKTTAGRVQMAEQLLQMGLIKTPEQYFTVINTGRMDPMMEDDQSELFNIQAENERLVSGKPIIALPTDRHSIHIREHRAVLADPELRLNVELSQRVHNHMLEHLQHLQQAPPDLLMLINEQPLSPPGGSPARQPAPPTPPDQAMMGQGPAETPAPQAMLPLESPNLPQQPTPPAPFQAVPVSPEELMPK